MKRLLVTGSRTWTDRDAIADALTQARTDLGDNTVLVHGDANGADRIAASIWCCGFRLCVEDWPADWTGPCRPTCKPDHRRRRPFGAETICPSAGPYRNEEMVAAGADLCLAFILDGSSGATGCAQLAEDAGIPVRPFKRSSR